MKTVRCVWIVAIALLALQAGMKPIGGAEPSPDEVLTSKGLTKVGTQYLLEADAKLQEKLRVVRQAQKQIETNRKKRASIEIDIARANDSIKQWNAQYRDLNARLTDSLSAVRHNQIVGQINVLVANEKEADKFREDRMKELKTIVDPNDDFVTNVFDLASKMEETAAQYETLGEDPAVKAALATLNLKAPPKVRLGPSAQFTAELKPMLKLRDSMNSAVIKCDMSSGLAEVPVSLNGKASQNMIVDSGASAISIGAAAAERAGLKPSNDDPEVDITIANGAKTKGRIMTLKSVRVGQFTVENVKCIVLPKSQKDAPNLLGGTFLRNFVYRMDLATGELHLTQMSGKPAKGETLASAATRPADKRATTAPALSGKKSASN
jgi:clan AA aspartic protease (TIGR02281 family)